MQAFGADDWKEIKSYDRAQNIVWEMLRYEGEGDKKIWLEEEEANNLTEWLFGYFPYRRMHPQQIQMIKTRENRLKREAAAAEEADAEGEDVNEEPAPTIGAGTIVGIGEVVTEHVEEEEEEEDISTSMGFPTTASTTTTSATPEGNAVGEKDNAAPPNNGEEALQSATSTQPSEAPTIEDHSHNTPQEEILPQEERPHQVPPTESVVCYENSSAPCEPLELTPVQNKSPVPSDSTSGTATNDADAARTYTSSAAAAESVDKSAQAEAPLRGRSCVARFFHTGPLKMDFKFVYGFAAISSSRFCTFWLETDADDLIDI